jgi:hypothetical protein
MQSFFISFWRSIPNPCPFKFSLINLVKLV